MKKTIITAVIALMCAAAFAQTESDFDVVLTSDGKGARITKYNGKAAAVRIPATIQGMPVKIVQGFENNTTITSVVIPQGVIEVSGFSGCTKLTSVTLPEGLEEIASSAFFKCTSLTAINIPQSVTIIGNVAFANCTSLTAINIPQGVTVIDSYAFANSGLRSVTIPSGFKVIIHEDPFYKTKSVSNKRIFADCKNLTTVNISEGVTGITEGMFSGCTALTTVTLPASIRIIYLQAFYGCSALTTLNIPDSVKSISFVKPPTFSSDNLVLLQFSGCVKLSLATQARLESLGY